MRLQAPEHNNFCLRLLLLLKRILICSKQLPWAGLSRWTSATLNYTIQWKTRTSGVLGWVNDKSGKTFSIKRHIDMRFHHVKELISNKTITLVKGSSGNQKRIYDLTTIYSLSVFSSSTARRFPYYFTSCHLREATSWCTVCGRTKYDARCR